MSTTPAAWPPDQEACYGTCCALHGNCARYDAVDRNSNPRQLFIDNCGPGHPLYMVTPAPVQLVELAAKAGQA